MKSAVVTARIEPDVLAELDRLGEHHDRSRAWLVAEAIRRHVAEERELIAFLDQGEDDFARGGSITHEALVAEIKALRDRKDAV